MCDPDITSEAAIRAVLHRYCRALDRMDKPMALSCWHEDATDDHAPLFSGPATAYVEWLWPVHAGMVSTVHQLHNVLVKITGSKSAVSESYYTVILRIRRDGALYDITAHGRYLDQLEFRNDCWAIAHRQNVVDLNRVDQVIGRLRDFADPPLIALDEVYGNHPPALSSRDHNDPLYALITPRQEI